MKRRILKPSAFSATPSDAFPKQARLDHWALAVACLMLIGANPVRADDLHVPADYATIQAAVDAAASGDTIHIAPGVYTEQTSIIGKDLTLIGRPGVTIRAFVGMQNPLAALGASAPALLGIGLCDVVVSGLSFEGDRLGDAVPGQLRGIYFLGAGGRVEGCRFTGFRASRQGDPVCIAVISFNPVSLGTGVVDLHVLRNTFADNNRSIEFSGEVSLPNRPAADRTILRTTISVYDNTVLGSGPDLTGQQYGIYIGTGVGGAVQRNIITDYSWVDPTIVPPAVSIGLFADGRLEPLQPLNIEDNIFRNNQVHCALIRTDGSVAMNNSFEGTAPGARPVGIAVSGEDVLVTGNRFSDMETGVVLLGDDPDFPDLGIASNATLADNGFCNVDTNYNFEPLTTYDLQNTLACPEPTLDVAEVVLLSWPFAYDGYSVEAADSADGPWTPFEATVFLQDGMHYVIVPSDGAPEFFRLVEP